RREQRISWRDRGFRRWNEQCRRVALTTYSFLPPDATARPRPLNRRGTGIPARQEPPMRPISRPCCRNGRRWGKILDLQDSHEIVAIAAGDLEAEGRGNDVDGAVAGKHHLADDINRLVVALEPLVLPMDGREVFHIGHAGARQ